MTQTAINYAKVLYQLKVPENVIEETRIVIKQNPEIVKVLANPVISFRQKEHIIDKIFSESMHNFFKVLSRYQSIECLEDIFVAYVQYVHEQHDIVDADLYYVTPPSEEQLEGIKRKLSKEYGKAKANINLYQKPELIGGFVIKVGDKETDCSILGRMNKMSQQLLRR